MWGDRFTESSPKTSGLIASALFTPSRITQRPRSVHIYGAGSDSQDVASLTKKRKLEAVQRDVAVLKTPTVHPEKPISQVSAGSSDPERDTLLRSPSQHRGSEENAPPMVNKVPQSDGEVTSDPSSTRKGLVPFSGSQNPLSSRLLMADTVSNSAGISSLDPHPCKPSPPSLHIPLVTSDPPLMIPPKAAADATGDGSGQPPSRGPSQIITRPPSPPQLFLAGLVCDTAVSGELDAKSSQSYVFKAESVLLSQPMVPALHGDAAVRDRHLEFSYTPSELIPTTSQTKRERPRPKPTRTSNDLISTSPLRKPKRVTPPSLGSLVVAKRPPVQVVGEQGSPSEILDSDMEPESLDETYYSSLASSRENTQPQLGGGEALVFGAHQLPLVAAVAAVEVGVMAAEARVDGETIESPALMMVATDSDPIVESIRDTSEPCELNDETGKARGELEKSEKQNQKGSKREGGKCLEMEKAAASVEGQSQKCPTPSTVSSVIPEGIPTSPHEKPSPSPSTPAPSTPASSTPVSSTPVSSTPVSPTPVPSTREAPITAKRLPATPRRKNVSLAELCGATSAKRYRVGLSKKTRVELLHRSLSKRE